MTQSRIQASRILATICGSVRKRRLAWAIGFIAVLGLVSVAQLCAQAPPTGTAAAAAATATATAAPPPGANPPSELVLVLKQGQVQKISIAAPAFLPPATIPFSEDAVGTINETFGADLDSSGVFVRLDPATYPPNPGDTLKTEDAVKWRDKGADVLVTGKIEITGGTNLVLDARVYDLKSARLIMGRRYKGNSTWARRIAHTLANDLLFYFTGRNGTFLSKIAFVSDRDGSKEIYVMDSDGESQTRITKGASLALHPDWAPDGSSIVYQFYSPTGPKLMRVQPGGGAPVGIPSPYDLNASPAFSPDGTKIAFVGAKKGNSAIFVINTDGTGIRQLTPLRGVEAAPCWSPTGREIAFVSNRAGSPQIYLMDAEGANVRRLTYEGTYNDNPAWCPTDPSKIAFTTRSSGDFNIALIDLANGQQYLLTDKGRNESPSWSPDGLRIVFSSTRNGGEQVFVMEANGANPRALTHEGNNFSPSWSRIGL